MAGHADGANMLFKMLWHLMEGWYYGAVLCITADRDWRDYKTDRARSAYDNFISLWMENSTVMLSFRLKTAYGFSGQGTGNTAFCAMIQNTNLMLEVQAAQEYTDSRKIYASFAYVEGGIGFQYLSEDISKFRKETDILYLI